MPDCQFRTNFAPNQRYCFGNIFDFRTQRRVKVYGWNKREIVSVFKDTLKQYEGCCLDWTQTLEDKCIRGAYGNVEVYYPTPDSNGNHIQVYQGIGDVRVETLDVKAHVYYSSDGEFSYGDPYIYYCDCQGFCGEVGGSRRRLRNYYEPEHAPTGFKFIQIIPPEIERVCTTVVVEQLPTGEIIERDRLIHASRDLNVTSLCPTVTHNEVESPVEDHAREITIGSWEYILVTKYFLDSRGNIVGYSPYNAINIYIGSLLAMPNESAFINYETFIFGVYHVAQFRNLPNCPHPRVEVVCEPIEDKDECPPGTCEVDCGNVICCYDNQGNPVKSIKK